MKYKKYIQLVIVLFLIPFIQCNSQCGESFCLSTKLLKKENKIYLRLSFNSNIENDSIKIIFDNKAFTLECPLYQEDKKLFVGVVPKIENLKFSQLVIENEKGDFRVYSSKRFYGIEDVRILEEINCSLYEIDHVIFNRENKQYIKTVLIDDIRDLQIEDNDEKIRLHFYFKPTFEMQDYGYKPIIITSINWLNLDIR